MSKPSGQPLLNIAAAAERLGTSERHIRRLVFAKQIEYVKVGRLVRFDPAALDRWVEAQTVPVMEWDFEEVSP